MKKISIISLTVFLLILKSIPIYSQVVHFKGNIFYDINRKIDSIRIQNTGKNIDTLLINTDSIDLSTLTKLNDDNSDNGFEVSDIINPDKSFFLIRNIKDDIIDVVISDILGKKIFQKSYFIKSGENQILIDFNEYYDGLYFISFYGSNKIITKRLLIADDIFINNNFIQNPSQQQKKVFIQSADNYNFIGYSGNCIPDTISNVTPINNYTYKFYFILDTNLLPAKRIHLEFNLPNTVFKDWWHYSYPPDVNMLDTIVFQKDYSHNIIGCSELSHNDTFNISSIPYHYFICDMSFWTFEFNFDNKNKKINYFQYLNSKDIANNNSLTEICLKIVINEIDFVQKENKYILFLNDKELEYRMKSKNVQFEYSESYTPYSTAQFGGYDLEEIISFDEDSFLKITIEK